MPTEIAKYPKIVSFETSRAFRYLWLKYIHSFDLQQHCAKCLLGKYSQLFSDEHPTIEIADFPLNEAEAKYYYLCGVTLPYVWRNNLHIAFRYKENARLIYDDGYTKLVAENAEQIPIYAQMDYSLEPKGAKAAFNTCRNWRFAYQMTHILKDLQL